MEVKVFTFLFHLIHTYTHTVILSWQLYRWAEIDQIPRILDPLVRNHWPGSVNHYSAVYNLNVSSLIRVVITILPIHCVIILSVLYSPMKVPLDLGRTLHVLKYVENYVQLNYCIIIYHVLWVCVTFDCTFYRFKFLNYIYTIIYEYIKNIYFNTFWL